MLRRLRSALRLREKPTYVIGGLYSIEWGDGSYGVIKMLRDDKDGVHVRLFANEWPERPAKVDRELLDMGSVHRGGRVGSGHLPLTREMLGTWKPTLIIVEDIADSELEGFEEWRRAEGGYFGGREMDPLSAQGLMAVVESIVRQGEAHGSDEA